LNKLKKSNPSLRNNSKNKYSIGSSNRGKSVNINQGTIIGEQHHQQAKPVAGTDVVVKKTVTCYACNEKGHYANKCPFREAVQ